MVVCILMKLCWHKWKTQNRDIAAVTKGITTCLFWVFFNQKDIGTLNVQAQQDTRVKEILSLQTKISCSVYQDMVRMVSKKNEITENTVKIQTKKFSGTVSFYLEDICN